LDWLSGSDYAERRFGVDPSWEWVAVWGVVMCGCLWALGGGGRCTPSVRPGWIRVRTGTEREPSTGVRELSVDSTTASPQVQVVLAAGLGLPFRAPTWANSVCGHIQCAQFCRIVRMERGWIGRSTTNSVCS
jgi:hypothetical protein